ncbi:hypothetical protein K435DRAFT_963448 [Dendrothele bispora CBS 962.96]|uniref:RNA-binding domain-containing protein n=1 Tax=Dendrothele bispora (strain CBS 962.96) TaxID=1314807 RepID=A0A4S8MGU0_DENBC|nr:hypothetical protein K435DRAFT_964496 [Dendrothele bispora CBS 962.96]THV01722.1 hypothetical protein K435DRAFT_963448 [Dendrothele bispora CBS 962.96]
MDTENEENSILGSGYQAYDNSQYDDSAPYDTGYSQGRQGQSQDYSQDRNRSGNLPRKRLQPSEPSPHVIFLGLDSDFTEADLQAYLNSHGCSVETVTIIRDRLTGVSKGFGFAQFSTSDHARAFVDPLFPFISVPPPASHGALATQAYYKALESGTYNGRKVKIDYSQSASPHEKGRLNRGNANDGTRDIGNTQGPVLLFRGLDPLSGPQAIHQAIKSSAGPGREGARGMKRIILIKDKVTMASFGFAFVEFIDVQSASTVLANSMSPQIHPNGFRISDRPVAASFAHPDSFQPIQEIMLRDEACLTSSLALGGVEGTWVRYWDESSTVAVIEFQVAQPTQQAASSTGKEKKDKKKKEPTSQNFAPSAPSALPVSDKPVTLSFKPKQATSAVVKPLTLGFSADEIAPEESVETEEENKAAASKKVAPLIASKKTVSNITKWNQVQEELSSSSTVPTPSIAASSSNAPVSEPGPIPTDDLFEFSDTNGLGCFLCARQFKSLDQLKRHNKESELHKARFATKNYKDTNLREVARQKLGARAGNKEDQPKYRDRASERRILFNQPEAPVFESDNGFKTGKKRQAEGPPPPPRVVTPPQPLNPGEDENNVGNKLLKMMGWTEGTGLGTSGDGRTEPIKTAIYAEGVGLGASKGKEIGQFTEGYSGYLAMAQNSARERYQS